MKFLIVLIVLLSFNSFTKEITISCYGESFTLQGCSQFYYNLICTYSGDYRLKEILSDGYGSPEAGGSKVVFAAEAPDGCNS